MSDAKPLTPEQFERLTALCRKEPWTELEQLELAVQFPAALASIAELAEALRDAHNILRESPCLCGVNFVCTRCKVRVRADELLKKHKEPK
jgi:hypothetical protein